MAEHGSESRDANRGPREFGSARGLIHMSDDFDEPAAGEGVLADSNPGEQAGASAHLPQAGRGALTPMLDQAIQAAKALPESEQDALAAEILEWIEDQRRWAESFASTHEALAELAREALAEHHAGQTLDAAYAEMALDESREAQAAERSDALFADADDQAGEPRPRAAD